MDNKKIHENTYIFSGSVIVGDVTIGENTSIWYNAVLRADADKINIGKYSNIQDNATVHVDKGFPVNIGDNVTIGHGAIIHGCSIDDNCIIGMGAIVLNGAKIGRNCIIGAGTLVPGGKEIPDGSVAFGNPVKIHRQVTEDDIAHIQENALEYISLAKDNI